jgi:hypothetical protein
MDNLVQGHLIIQLIICISFSLLIIFISNHELSYLSHKFWTMIYLTNISLRYLLIMRRTSILEMKLTGYPWIPANQMGTSLGTISNLLGTSFLMSIYIFQGYEFGMAKTNMEGVYN